MPPLVCRLVCADRLYNFPVPPANAYRKLAPPPITPDLGPLGSIVDAHAGGGKTLGLGTTSYQDNA